MLFVEDVSRLKQKLENVIEQYHTNAKSFRKRYASTGFFLMYPEPENVYRQLRDGKWSI